MILIGKNSYDQLASPLSEVAFNHLFARSVIEDRVNGCVYVDDRDDPETFYIVHPYGMSLLFGNPTNLTFNAAFKDYSLNVNRKRNNHEWMQAFSSDWDTVLKDLFGDSLVNAADNIADIRQSIVELNTRINFKFNKDKYLADKTDLGLKAKIKIIRSENAAFKKMVGSVVPSNFWNSPKDFGKNGVAYSLYYEGKMAATSFSSFCLGEQLELGIETVKEFRGKGLARIVCSSLIDYCIENGLEPVWACRLENTGSYKLALKLGFEPTLEIPYYRLSN